MLAKKLKIYELVNFFINVYQTKRLKSENKRETPLKKRNESVLNIRRNNPFIISDKGGAWV